MYVLGSKQPTTPPQCTRRPIAVQIQADRWFHLTRSDLYSHYSTKQNTHISLWSWR